VDGDADDISCGELKAKCSSLYTVGMRASNVLVGNQATCDCTSPHCTITATVTPGADDSKDDARVECAKWLQIRTAGIDVPP